MASPVLVDTPVGVWTKVATAVKTGNIWIINSSANYYHTYRDTGITAPTTDAEAVKLMIPGKKIESSIDIDVYIKATGADGRVRVDGV